MAGPVAYRRHGFGRAQSAGRAPPNTFCFSPLAWAAGCEGRSAADWSCDPRGHLLMLSIARIFSGRNPAFAGGGIG